MGDLYGTAPTVWFKHDPERLSKVNGCMPAVDHCGPVGGYHLDWQQVPTGLKFSRYVGLGDEDGPAPANWVASRGPRSPEPLTPMKPHRTIAWGVALIAVCLTILGCKPPSVGGQDRQRRGRAPAGQHRLARSGPASSWRPGAFVEAAKRLSGGRIQVSVEHNHGAGSAGAETDIVRAIAVGELDGGWPSTRAFSRAGLRGLEPVEAPFTLTSYAAEKALVTGPEGQNLLATLSGSGVVGLGLAVGPLRRPWAVDRPLVEPRSWRGVTFRSYDSPVEEEDIRSLGGVPLQAGWQFVSLLQNGRLRGVDLEVSLVVRNGYGHLLPAGVDNVVLWPRILVLALSAKRFASLTPQQQAWVRAAADEAVQASVRFAYEENSYARELCSQGVRFAEATPAQVAALRRATAGHGATDAGSGHRVLDARGAEHRGPVSRY